MRGDELRTERKNPRRYVLLSILLSQRLRAEETLEERQGGGGLEGGHHVAGEADRGEAEVLRAGGQAEASQ